MLVRFSAFLLLSATGFAQSACTTSGTAVPAAQALDQGIQSIMAKYQIPGAALAVSLQGKLVYSRGFGFADRTTGDCVKPDSLFRVASVSKAPTAVAILKLYEQGKLSLTTPAFSLLPDLPPSGNVTDPRVNSVTVEMLLNHTGGWDRDLAGDPMQQSVAIAAKINGPSPATCNDTIRYMLTQPLQHAPGTTYAYSNFGYCVLGSIIEHVTGQLYEQAVRQLVFLPLGIQRAKLATVILSDHPNGEVTYYDYPNAPLLQNVFDPTGPKVPAPYGGRNTDNSAANGGWVTSAIDLVRFMNGIDGRKGGPLLQASTIQMLQTKTSAFTGSLYYGLGFNMEPNGNGFNWSKDGAFPGTSAYIFRNSANGIDWAVVFNSLPNGSTDGSSASDNFENDFVGAIRGAITNITWPAGAADQFASYPSTLLTPALSSGNPVVQGATFQPGIVAGSWVTIQGSNLSTATRIWRNDEFNGSALPFYVDHVTVTINGQPAAIYYVSPTQLNVQAPALTANSQVQVVVTRDGQSSPPATAQVVSSAPGFFTYGNGGPSFVAAVHLNGVVVGDPSAVPGTTPAAPGEIIEAYATGLQSSPSGSVISSVTSLSDVTATIGSQPAAVQFAGLVGVGLFQINIVVPIRLTGSQPIAIQYNGNTSSPGPVIPIH